MSLLLIWLQVEREVVEEEKAVQGGLGLVIQNLAKALQLR